MKTFILPSRAVSYRHEGHSDTRCSMPHQGRAGVQVTSWRLACSVDRSRLPASTGTSLPTSSLASAGVATMAVSVDTVVMATDSGTSALARKVTTLEATPPGHEATRQILHPQQPPEQPSPRLHEAGNAAVVFMATCSSSAALCRMVTAMKARPPGQKTPEHTLKSR